MDVGEFPNADPADLEGEDPQRLVKLVAHAVARLGDRFAFVRKMSRHLEGEEKRAGILSDLFSAAVVLYRRNPEAAQQLGRRYVAEVRERRTVKTATTNGAGPIQQEEQHASG